MPKRTEEALTIEDFAYELPESLIAQEPAEIRHQSRLLKLNRDDQTISHHSFKDIVELLRAGDVLVVNDTRVIPARFYAARKSGGIIQILLVRPETTRPGLWEAMAARLRRLQPGEVLTTRGTEKEYLVKIVDIICGADGQKRLIIDLGSHLNTFHLLKDIGFAPLPPYIRREQPLFDQSSDAADDVASEFDFSPILDEKMRSKDLERYQTVFAEK